MRFRSPITGKFVSLATARRWNYPSEAQRLARIKNLVKARAAKKKKPKRKPVPSRVPVEEIEEITEPEGGISDFEGEQFFDDSFGEPDALDEWDDVPYFDSDEADEFIDEESDAYSEDEA